MPRHRVRLIGKDWKEIENGIRVEVIPRIDELILLKGIYYTVLQVIHTYDKPHGICLVIEERIENKQ